MSTRTAYDDDGRASLFGTDDDPRHDTALRPWQWLPITFLLVMSVLFVSLRRAQALQLYSRAKQRIQTRWSFVNSSTLPYVSLTRDDVTETRLERPRGRERTIHYSDDDNDDTYSDSDIDVTSPSLTSNNNRFESNSNKTRSPYDESFDEFPKSNYISPVQRIERVSDSVKTGLKSVVDTLGWGSGRAHHAFTDVDNSRPNDGIARAFWGVRSARRTGTIKLSDSVIGDEEAVMGSVRSSHDGNETDGTLFELERDQEGANELPGNFRLGD
ncbi:hypothetical protein OIO90_000548 [Microbotryomycetes sp. JL221]|nr:hypothetical protein OIO90_000548 [Microbotryomycetes sp. JL221]